MRKLILIVCNLLSLLCFGQQNGGIRGQVVRGGSCDEKGICTPIDSAQVTLRNGADSIVTWTDSTGTFRLLNIPPATYTMIVRRRSYQEQVLRGVIVAEMKTTYFTYPPVAMQYEGKGVRLIPDTDE